ncbi:unnamed protein product [Closterium sp. Naga37s-1]|nr:unnamed protein product [Closterium sp. Naga37s-1]
MEAWGRVIRGLQAVDVHLHGMRMALDTGQIKESPLALLHELRPPLVLLARSVGLTRARAHNPSHPRTLASSSQPFALNPVVSLASLPSSLPAALPLALPAARPAGVCEQHARVKPGGIAVLPLQRAHSSVRGSLSVRDSIQRGSVRDSMQEGSVGDSMQGGSAGRARQSHVEPKQLFTESPAAATPAASTFVESKNSAAAPAPPLPPILPAAHAAAATGNHPTTNTPPSASSSPSLPYPTALPHALSGAGATNNRSSRSSSGLPHASSGAAETTASRRSSASCTALHHSETSSFTRRLSHEHARMPQVLSLIDVTIAVAGGDQGGVGGEEEGEEGEEEQEEDEEEDRGDEEGGVRKITEMGGGQGRDLEGKGKARRTRIKPKKREEIQGRQQSGIVRCCDRLSAACFPCACIFTASARFLSALLSLLSSLLSFLLSATRFLLTSLSASFSSENALPRAIASFKVTLAIVTSALLGGLVSPTFDFWAAVTVAFVSGGYQGGSFKASMLRLQGTVAGAVFGYLLVPLTTDRMALLLVALAVWVFFTAFVRTSKEYGYAGVVAAFTAAIIMLGYPALNSPPPPPALSPSSPPPSPPSSSVSLSDLTVEHYALLRITETCIGLVSVILIELLVFPTRAAALARAELVANITRCRVCAATVAWSYFGGTFGGRLGGRFGDGPGGVGGGREVGRYGGRSSWAGWFGRWFRGRGKGGRGGEGGRGGDGGGRRGSGVDDERRERRGSEGCERGAVGKAKHVPASADKKAGYSVEMGQRGGQAEVTLESAQRAEGGVTGMDGGVESGAVQMNGGRGNLADVLDSVRGPVSEPVGGSVAVFIPAAHGDGWDGEGDVGSDSGDRERQQQQEGEVERIDSAADLLGRERGGAEEGARQRARRRSGRGGREERERRGGFAGRRQWRAAGGSGGQGKRQGQWQWPWMRLWEPQVSKQQGQTQQPQQRQQQQQEEEEERVMTKSRETGHEREERRRREKAGAVKRVAELQAAVAASMARQQVLLDEATAEPALWHAPFPEPAYKRLLASQQRMHQLLYFMDCSLRAVASVEGREREERREREMEVAREGWRVLEEKRARGREGEREGEGESGVAQMEVGGRGEGGEGGVEGGVGAESGVGADGGNRVGGAVGEGVGEALGGAVGGRELVRSSEPLPTVAANRETSAGGMGTGGEMADISYAGPSARFEMLDGSSGERSREGERLGEAAVSQGALAVAGAPIATAAAPPSRYLPAGVGAGMGMGLGSGAGGGAGAGAVGMGVGVKVLHGRPNETGREVERLVQPLRGALREMEEEMVVALWCVERALVWGHGSWAGVVGGGEGEEAWEEEWEEWEDGEHIEWEWDEEERREGSEGSWDGGELRGGGTGGGRRVESVREGKEEEEVEGLVRREKECGVGGSSGEGVGGEAHAKRLVWRVGSGDSDEEEEGDDERKGRKEGKEEELEKEEKNVNEEERQWQQQGRQEGSSRGWSRRGSGGRRVSFGGNQSTRLGGESGEAGERDEGDGRTRVRRRRSEPVAGRGTAGVGGASGVSPGAGGSVSGSGSGRVSGRGERKARWTVGGGMEAHSDTHTHPDSHPDSHPRRHLPAHNHKIQWLLPSLASALPSLPPLPAAPTPHRRSLPLLHRRQQQQHHHQSFGGFRSWRWRVGAFQGGMGDEVGGSVRPLLAEDGSGRGEGGGEGRGEGSGEDRKEERVEGSREEREGEESNRVVDSAVRVSVEGTDATTQEGRSGRGETTQNTRHRDESTPCTGTRRAVAGAHGTTTRGRRGGRKRAMEGFVREYNDVLDGDDAAFEAPQKSSQKYNHVLDGPDAAAAGHGTNTRGRRAGRKRAMEGFVREYNHVLDVLIASKKQHPEESIVRNSAMLSFNSLVFSMQALMEESEELARSAREMLLVEQPLDVGHMAAIRFT